MWIACHHIRRPASTLLAYVTGLSLRCQPTFLIVIIIVSRYHRQCLFFLLCHGLPQDGLMPYVTSLPLACIIGYLYAYGLPSLSLSYHRYRHRPFPVQVELLSFSCM
jgi:hypothetical protein